jgi:membrane protein
MKKKMRRFIRRILFTIGRPEMAILPGQLAFFFVLSLVPIVSLIGVLASVFNVSADKVFEFLNVSFSADVTNAINVVLKGKGFDSNIGLFLFSAFIIASNGMYSIVVASNILYGVENKNYIRLHIKAILLTLIVIGLIIFNLVVPAFGGQIINLIRNSSVSPDVIDRIYWMYNILKYPLSFIFIYFNIKLIYTVAPDIKIYSKDVTYGAVFTSLIWILATRIFSYYVGHFARYDVFYGSLSNIVALMFWVYILCYVLVLGMALNASKEELDKTLINIGK